MAYVSYFDVLTFICTKIATLYNLALYDVVFKEYCFLCHFY